MKIMSGTSRKNIEIGMLVGKHPMISYVQKPFKPQRKKAPG